MNNYRFCYNCGKKIPKNAKICPYCHKPQTDSKSKANLNSKPKQNNTQNTQANHNQAQPQTHQQYQRRPQQSQPNYNNQPQSQPWSNNSGQTVNARTGQANYNYNQPRQPQQITPQNGQAIVNQRITPPPCSFGLAFKLYWVNYVNFSGYSSRSEYWWWFLWSLILGIGLGICTFGIGDIIFGLACIIPSLSLLARRLRDAGLHNGGIITLEILNFVPFIDIISSIICLIFCLMPSVRQEIH